MNRQWILARRPKGAADLECFEYREMATLPGQDGEVCVQWELMLCAPTIRNWISGNRNSYYPTVEIGEPILSPAIGRIVESRNPAFVIGQRLWGIGSWQDYQWIDPLAFQIVPPDITSVDAMGVYGLNALTAYTGLIRFGLPQKGETLLVSGAAGSVGSVVAQIGHIMGLNVVGIAGGPAKLKWLREDCGITNLIDYKSEDCAARLDAYFPDGIDIYFDNVGGDMLEMAAARMRPLGRIVLCGQISHYDDGQPILPPPIDMMRIIYGEIRINGFLITRHADLQPQALKDLRAWNDKGILSHREDVRDGMKDLPETFSRLFNGANVGTLLARISSPEGATL